MQLKEARQKSLQIMAEAQASRDQIVSQDATRDRLQDTLHCAIILLRAAKDALPSDDVIYLRIRAFLDNEVVAE